MMLLSFDLYVVQGTCFSYGWTKNGKRSSMELKETFTLVNEMSSKDLTEEDLCYLTFRFLSRGTSLYPGCLTDIMTEEVMKMSKGDLIELLAQQCNAELSLVPHTETYIASGCCDFGDIAKKVLNYFEHVHWSSSTSRFLMDAPIFYRNIVIILVGHSAKHEADLIVSSLNDNVFFSFKKSEPFMVSHKDEGLCVVAGKNIIFVSNEGKGPGLLLKELQFCFKNVHCWTEKIKLWIKLVP